MGLLSNYKIRQVVLLYKRAGLKGVINAATGYSSRKIGINKYKSCIYIESGLAFFNDNVRFCCVSNSYTNTVITTYDDIDKLDGSKITKLRKSLKNSPFTECEQCTLFTKAAWRTNQKFQIINLLHGDICNFRCQYCYQTIDNEYTPQKPTHPILPHLQHLYENNLISEDAIFAFGGEPALHPEFKDFLMFIKKLKRGYSTITTNASVYVDTIEELLKSNKCEVLCSVDAGSQEVFKKVKGVDSFHKVIDHLKRYAVAGRVVAKYIVFDSNCDPDEIIKFIKIMREINVASVKIAFDLRSKNDEPLDRHLMCAAIGKMWAEFLKVDIIVDFWAFKYAKQMNKKINKYYKQVYNTQKQIYLNRNNQEG